MTAAKALEVTKFLQKCFQKTVIAVMEGTNGKVYRIDVPFFDTGGQCFRLWIFSSSDGKLQMSDGGRTIKTIAKAGTLQMSAIQGLVESYDLSVMEDNTIMDITNRSYFERVTSFIQVFAAVDGSLRIWEQMKASKTA